ncbi:MAG: hypothetical protein UT32_C0031G0010 [Parcubacteria group bacterium GW2011_GWC2_39_14]|nr:MAG: hypothetical protein UT32_C0031G0010 [Parcubacteria group bacterium GW2011_GWC2_39_14]KKR53365.1 MAG: hypothetical protein UT91_C0029G0011 [Parcubacteria group bacterium GW2011_GWA2_40_23]
MLESGGVDFYFCILQLYFTMNMPMITTLITYYDYHDYEMITMISLRNNLP